MKIKPDTAPLVDLTQHRRPEEYENSSFLRCTGSALVLILLGIAGYAGLVWMAFTYGKP